VNALKPLAGPRIAHAFSSPLSAYDVTAMIGMDRNVTSALIRLKGRSVEEFE